MKNEHFLHTEKLNTFFTLKQERTFFTLKQVRTPHTATLGPPSSFRFCELCTHLISDTPTTSFLRLTEAHRASALSLRHVTEAVFWVNGEIRRHRVTNFHKHGPRGVDLTVAERLYSCTGGGGGSATGGVVEVSSKGRVTFVGAAAGGGSGGHGVKKTRKREKVQRTRPFTDHDYFPPCKGLSMTPLEWGAFIEQYVDDDDRSELEECLVPLASTKRMRGGASYSSSSSSSSSSASSASSSSSQTMDGLARLFGGMLRVTVPASASAASVRGALETTTQEPPTFPFLKKSSMYQPCCLCPRRGPWAMFRAADGRWAHVVCCFFTHACEVSNFERKGRGAPVVMGTWNDIEILIGPLQ